MMEGASPVAPAGAAVCHRGIRFMRISGRARRLRIVPEVSKSIGRVLRNFFISSITCASFER